MGAIRSIGQFFSNHCETGEKHEDPSLRTRYYKVTNSNAIKMIDELLSSEPGIKVTSVSKEHGELSVEMTSPKKAFIVVSIISVRPYETAVDFSVTYEGLLSLGYTKVIVKKLYNMINEKLSPLR
ncbi:cytosolic protein [Bacillus suaedaesalsae]|uniref:Cytosolic protein n=1 Tax=Bacillus suaedaesalsae TaxID=2810349 RepID=A0ABS2DHJ8_9BACI|nr:cytosolic protein [Bacillus suaedaesalsae]MBM6617505.1 cytosolic protein [Bacillus suaedaesalsae]